MTTAVGSILGALFVIYNSLPLIGIHVPVLSPESTGGLTALIAFVTGLFTHPPNVPPKGSIQAVTKAQEEYVKSGGILPSVGK